MRLELFDLIDESCKVLEMNEATYQYIQGLLIQNFRELLSDVSESVVDFNARIKSNESLKEKMIRNKYYLNFSTGKEVLENLPDLIGITAGCRFISDETVIYEKILEQFNTSSPDFTCSKNNPSLFLNLHMPQPQLQRNGFTIYRIDGYYMFNEHRFNFELQIKSLVHSFWSEVEHQVVYKNTKYVMFDSFMKDILRSLRDNLEVVDHQLQIVYRQILNETRDSRDVGMSENGFKMFMAKAISDLYSLKMIESIGFTTDFKKCSAVLSQYVYIKDFVQYDSPQQKMVEYFEHFNLLKISDLDFTEPIALEKDYFHYDPFCDTLGKYWQEVINIDYEWHVFFVMLFAIQPGNNIQDFSMFVEVIKNLIINPTWYSHCFSELPDIEAQKVRDEFSSCLAKCMVETGKIEIVHEDKLFDMMEAFKHFIEKTDNEISSYEDYLTRQKALSDLLHNNIMSLF